MKCFLNDPVASFIIRFRKIGIFFAFLTALVVVYSPLFQSAYQNWDDPGHCFEQPQVVAGNWQAIKDVFLQENTVNRTYVPLTIVSFILEKKIFGLSPGSAHAINVILHLVVVCFVYIFGRLIGCSFAAAVAGAALFAFHPMHVESVAWITERKDVLYSVFYLLSLIFYIRFLDRKEGHFYIASLLMAILSLFSKPMALSLPLIFLLIDYFKNRCFDKIIILEKIPFVVVVILIAGITYQMNSRPLTWAFPDSILIWIWSAFFYIKEFFFPVNLRSLHDIPVPVSIVNPEYLLAVLGFSCLVIVFFFRHRCRWLFFAIFFYVLSAFFLWRFDVYDNTIVADRFMYLPSVGICLFIGYIWHQWIRQSHFKQIAGIILMAVICCLLAVTTRAQVSYWRNSWTLWSHMLEQKPDLFFARYMLAQAILEEGFFKTVRPDFEIYVKEHLSSRPSTKKHMETIRRKLPYFSALYGIRYFHRELELGLSMPEGFQRIPRDYIYNGYGAAFCLVGDFKRSMEYTRKALASGPVRVVELVNAANNSYFLGNFKDAVHFYTRIIDKEPDYYAALLKRGAMHAQLGNNGLALNDVLRLMTINNEDPRVYDLMFNLFISMRKDNEAQEVIRRESVLWPNELQILWHKGVLAHHRGDEAAAQLFYKKARRSGYGL